MIHRITKTRERDTGKKKEGVCFRTSFFFLPRRTKKTESKRATTLLPYLLLTSLLSVVLLLTQTLHGLVAAEACFVASFLGHFLGVSDILGRLLDTLFFESLWLSTKNEIGCYHDVIVDDKKKVDGAYRNYLAALLSLGLFGVKILLSPGVILPMVQGSKSRKIRVSQQIVFLLVFLL